MLSKAATRSVTCGTLATEGIITHTTSNSLLNSVRTISYSDLKIGDCCGKGAFGTCYAGKMAHMQVCIKVYRLGCEYSFPSEGHLLSLCSHENIPWIYGIVREQSKPKMLVMSWHGIDGKAFSLYRLLKDLSPGCILKLSSQTSKDIILGVISALFCLHSKNMLHNDIKCDNIIVERSFSGVKGFLVDFGKACLISNAKSYKLSAEDRLKYTKNHPQIAPDLRDGHGKQSTASDIYSFGRILKIINEAIIKLPVLGKTSSACTSYSSIDRPTTEGLHKSLFFLFSESYRDS